jgi:hypothetical protein
MRTTVAVLLAIPILVVGVTAIGTQANQSETPAYDAGGQNASAYNLSTGVFGGVTTATGPGVVFMGIGVLIVGALGVLVAAGKTGRGRR